MGFFMTRSFLFLSILFALLSCDSSEPKEQKQPQEFARDDSKPKLHEIVSTAEQDSALNEINQRIRENINDPELYVERSEVYLDIGDTEAALNDLDRAYRLDSINFKVLMAQADFLTRGGRMDGAMRILERARKYHEEESDLYIRISELYLVVQNYKESLKYADLAVKYDIYNEKAYFIKAFNFLAMGDTTKAISSFQTSVEQNPDYYEGYLQLGLVYSDLGNPLAIDYFKNALEVRPNDRDALYAKGMFEQENDLLNEAMQTYTQAIKAHPEFREAYYNMGYVHMYYLKLYSEGLRYFDQAIKADPEYYQAYYNRGYSFELMGDIKNAETDYKRALQIKPDYTLAAQGLERVTADIQ